MSVKLSDDFSDANQVIVISENDLNPILLLPMIYRLAEVLESQGQGANPIKVISPQSAHEVIELSLKRGLLRWRDQIKVSSRKDFSHADTIYCLDRGVGAGFRAWRSGVRECVGYSSAIASFFYTKSTMQKWGSSYPEIERKLDLLRARWPSVDIAPWDTRRALSLLAPGNKVGRQDKDPVVMIAMGSEASGLCWPAEKISELAKEMVNQGVEVWLVGDEAATTKASMVQKLLPSLLIKNLCASRRVEDFVNLMESCDLLVSFDRLPIYLANDLNLPVVALYSASIAEMGFGSWRINASALGVAGLECKACDAEIFGNSSPQKHRCVRDISVDRVYREARRLVDFLS